MNKWKWIEAYQGKYMVSIDGQIERYSKNGKARLRKLSLSNFGYKKVNLYKEGRVKVFFVHRFVAQTFIPKFSEKLIEVNHKNGIKTDNRIENLEWCTSSENQKHAYSIGLKKPKKGELNGMSKVTSVQIERIKLMKEFEPKLSTEIIGKRFNITGRNVRYLLKTK